MTPNRSEKGWHKKIGKGDPELGRDSEGKAPPPLMEYGVRDCFRVSHGRNFGKNLLRAGEDWRSRETLSSRRGRGKIKKRVRGGIRGAICNTSKKRCKQLVDIGALLM